MRVAKLCATALIFILLAGMGEAKAQIVTGQTGYRWLPLPVAGWAVDPSGTFSIPNPAVRREVWRVTFNFGTINNGAFVPLPAVAGVGLPANLAIPPVPLGAPAAGPAAPWPIPPAPAVGPIPLPPGWPVAPGTVFMAITLQSDLGAGLWIDRSTIFLSCP